MNFKNNALKYFLRSLEREPQSIFLDDRGERYSYSRAFERMRGIATQLRALDDRCIPVVILLSKSADALLGMHACSLAGKIYCPVDVKSPRSRLISMLSILGDAIIICSEQTKELAQSILSGEQKVLDISNVDVNTAEKDGGSLEDFADIKRISSDPCYIIFTSGSTGVPKGVTVSHENIIDYIEWAQATYHGLEHEKVLSQAPFYFDNSTLDIYLTSATTSTLFLVNEQDFIFPEKIVDKISQKGISMIFWVPSVLISLVNKKLLNADALKSLKWVLFAGEVMPATHLKAWINAIPNCRFSNLYGPTEITVDCTYFIVPDGWDEDVVPIGVACENSRILILSEDNKLVSKGELCVSGPGVSLGYWNNKPQTEKSFSQNPLQENYRDVIYRTGDIVESRNGLLYFVGRKDFQVKINGYRVELGEIEEAAHNLAAIDVAVAIFSQDTKSVFLFYEGEAASESALKKQLLAFIPKYMLPNKIIRLSTLPLTASGKFNRLELMEIK